MKRYVSILRGINVGGYRKILMKDLVSLLEKDGFKNVKTYIQSGNVAFDSEVTTIVVLEGKIKLLIEKQFGFDVPVIVLTKEEIEETIENFPFADEVNTHVTFLQSIPLDEYIIKLNANNYAPEEFIIKGKTVYLKSIEKYHQSKLSNSFFEKNLKTAATTRNWKTVQKLKELAEAK